MTKTTTSAMDTHLAEETTTLATLWRITRLDGTEFFFTDHDVDIVFGGNTYRADTGYRRTAIANDSTLSVDNLDVEGVFDDDAITEEELRAGLFDYAQVRISVVNWADLSADEIKMRNGRLGETTLTTQGIFRAELRGMSQLLSRRIGELYQPECRADLGDSRCKVPVQPAVRADSTAYTAGQFARVATAAGSTQAIYENRIYECTWAGTTAATPPTFDTTVGNTTLDGWTAATGVLTLTANPSAAEQVVVGSVTYTFVSSLTGANDVLIGADSTETLDNLAAAVNGAAGEGSTYGTGTVANPDATGARTDTQEFTATAVIPSANAGNDLATTETLANGSWGDTTMDGGVAGAVWIARQAWTRHGTVLSSADNSTLVLAAGDYDEARDVDDWYNGGALTFETGDNAGATVEIRDWVRSTRTVTLFLPVAYPIAAGAAVRLYPGCDKRVETCEDKFQMPGTLLFPIGNVKNFRGEPYVPGQDVITSYPDAKS